MDGLWYAVRSVAAGVPVVGVKRTIGGADRSRRPRRLRAGACPLMEGDRMSYILAIMLVGPLGATGIYNPPVMHHGRCIAEPGSFDALYCPAPGAPQQHPRRHAKK